MTTNYTFTVKTGTGARAGFDGPVSINVGTTTIPLNFSINKDPSKKKEDDLFESGKTDTFATALANLGEITKITVVLGESTTMRDNEWELESITINDGTKDYYFEHKKSIQEKTQVELTAIPKPVAPAAAANPVAPAAAANTAAPAAANTAAPAAANTAAPATAYTAAPAKQTNTGSKKLTLASIIRKTASEEYIAQQLRQQLAKLSGELVKECGECNTIRPSEWKDNDCNVKCTNLEKTVGNNRGMFEKRHQLIELLEKDISVKLTKIFPDNQDRNDFYQRYFYSKLRDNGSFEDSMIDMNDKLEDFIDRVNRIYQDYNSKDTELSSSQDDRIKKGTTVKLDYNQSPVKFYFKPTDQTFDDFSSLNSTISSLSEDEIYCKRKKFLSCAIRNHRCDWIGDRNEYNKCQPKVSSGSTTQGAQGANQLPPCADPADPGKGTTCSGGSRNISKQKKKVIRNLSKRRYF